ncbi:hypothetical protein EZV62_007321 [Acer yangbiense]|uniref:Uncharacterized protein n=1 Tax=Acer yangbiense TaxID=1000413 RepID=A0A5C7IC67_9ROSI|nr:hypothetical protein EZV62_007321 [Acer yangbiense]
MSENAYSDAKALDLLNELERILESDPLIDEVGFVHPSQFSTLKEAAGASASSQDISEHENTNFWIRDHKLGISTQVLLPLYKAAKHAFMAALREYKTSENLPGNSGDDSLESEVMSHSKTLLMLSCDFGSAWNSRKFIVLKKQLLPMFIDELLLSALILSYAPKSDRAWSHRRWVIHTISGNSILQQQIIEGESELVEKIAEGDEMAKIKNELPCMEPSLLVLHQLEKSRNWASLHVADSSCFHYRRDELDWNEALIKRYVGREFLAYNGDALWLHRRFLSSYWIRHSAIDLHGVSYQFDFGSFIDHELCLLDSCSTIPDDDFEDFQAQAIHSATYIVWLTKQIPEPQRIDIQEKLRARDLIRLLNTACPERSSLWDCLVGAEASSQV